MFADLFTEVLQAINRNRLRAAATGFAVTSGIFLLIVLLGAGNGVIHTLEKNSGSLSLDAVYIFPGRTSKPHAGYAQWRRIQLENKDGDLAVHVAPDNVISISPALSQSTVVMTETNKVLSASLNGTDPYFLENMGYELLHGRFLNKIDIMEKRKVAVLCETLVDRLYGKGADVVSKLLNIDGSMYRIVGVLKDNNSRYNTSVMIPHSTIEAVYNKRRYVDNLILKTRGLETQASYSVFEKAYMKVMSAVHQFAPDDPTALHMFGGGANAETMSVAFSAIRGAFWFLGILTLLSGVTGVGNIMLISVRERTHEFGIRKALGAAPWHIISMVILESVLVTTIFGYIGMLGGIAFCEYMDYAAGSSVVDVGMQQMQYFQDPTVGIDICIEATLVMIFAGAIAGFFPARKAALIKPIEALQAK